VVKILKFFDEDPGCKKVGSGIRDKHPGSATLASNGETVGVFYEPDL
jgi:hypothetical protein